MTDFIVRWGMQFGRLLRDIGRHLFGEQRNEALPMPSPDPHADDNSESPSTLRDDATSSDENSAEPTTVTSHPDCGARSHPAAFTSSQRPSDHYGTCQRSSTPQPSPTPQPSSQTPPTSQTPPSPQPRQEVRSILQVWDLPSVDSAPTGGEAGPLAILTRTSASSTKCITITINCESSIVKYVIDANTLKKALESLFRRYPEFFHRKVWWHYICPLGEQADGISEDDHPIISHFKAFGKALSGIVGDLVVACPRRGIESRAPSPLGLDRTSDSSSQPPRCLAAGTPQSQQPAAVDNRDESGLARDAGEISPSSKDFAGDKTQPLLSDLPAPRIPAGDSDQECLLEDTPVVSMCPAVSGALQSELCVPRLSEEDRQAISSQGVQAALTKDGAQAESRQDETVTDNELIASGLPSTAVPLFADLSLLQKSQPSLILLDSSVQPSHPTASLTGINPSVLGPTDQNLLLDILRDCPPPSIPLSELQQVVLNYGQMEQINLRLEAFIREHPPPHIRLSDIQQSWNTLSNNLSWQRSKDVFWPLDIPLQRPPPSILDMCPALSGHCRKRTYGDSFWADTPCEPVPRKKIRLSRFEMIVQLKLDALVRQHAGQHISPQTLASWERGIRREMKMTIVWRRWLNDASANPLPMEMALVRTASQQTSPRRHPASWRWRLGSSFARTTEHPQASGRSRQ